MVVSTILHVYQSKRAGATVLVAGSAVFGAEDRAHMIEAIRNN